MDKEIRSYLTKIGRRGGIKSRRSLASEAARDMVRLREGKRDFQKFYARCFWHPNPNLKLTTDMLPLIAKGLRSHGGHEGSRIAEKLSR